MFDGGSDAFAYAKPKVNTYIYFWLDLFNDAMYWIVLNAIWLFASTCEKIPFRKCYFCYKSR